MIRVIPVGVGTNVTVQKPDLSALNKTVSILEIHSTVSSGFDLSAGKDDSRFQPLQNLVIMKSLAVYSDLFHRIAPGVAPRVPGPAGCCCGAGTTGSPAAGCARIGIGGAFAPIGGGICPGTAVFTGSALGLADAAGLAFAGLAFAGAPVPGNGALMITGWFGFPWAGFPGWIGDILGSGF